ncbi:hypothetical protein VU04_08055 [Desulfobulbus sp. TB]|nr:hypothetical protein [Desulfobulbus sp. TB]
MTYFDIALYLSWSVYNISVSFKKHNLGHIVAEQNDHIEKVKKLLPILGIGLGVGWLAGLSVSPVATILISGLLGIAIAIVGIISVSLTYRDDKDEIIRSVGFTAAQKISIGSLAWIVLGIAVGVSFGICVRTHNFLGVDDEPAFTGLRQELNELQSHCGDKWSELGIDKKEVAQRILDKYYPKVGGAVNKSAATTSGENKGTASALYETKAVSPCDTLQAVTDPSYRRGYITTMDKNRDNRFAGLDKLDDKQLDERIRSICSPSE